MIGRGKAELNRMHAKSLVHEGLHDGVDDVDKFVFSVLRLTIPCVALPSGSEVASRNRIPPLAAREANTAGTLAKSAFSRLKSAFSDSICERIWSSLMFSSAVR